MYTSVLEAIYEHSRNRTKRLAAADEKLSLNYGELWRLIVLEASVLGEKFGAGNYVLVECSQDAAFIVKCLACQYAGLISVPVEMQSPLERIQEIQRKIGTTAFIGRGDYEIGDKELCSAIQSDADNQPALEGFPRKDVVAEILYTTGTTGASKGIALTHGNNIAITENIICGTQMEEDSVELVPLPLSHSHGLRTVYANLVHGSSVVVCDGVIQIKRIFKLMDQYHVTALDLSPSAAQVLMKLSKGKFKDYREQIKFVQLGTAMLTENVKDLLRDTFPKSRLYNFYGSTEAGRTCSLDFNHERVGEGCIGHPSRNAHFIVVNEDGEEITQRGREHTGLLAVAGSMNMKEYIGEPKLTAEVMHGGYIYTSDISYIDAEGLVYVLGRADDIINYKGIKISPAEVEAIIIKYSGIKECALVAKEDTMCGQIPVLFIVPAEEYDEQRLVSHIKEFVEDNKQPKLIKKVDELPKASNGKILRRRLRECLGVS